MSFLFYGNCGHPVDYTIRAIQYVIKKDRLPYQNHPPKKVSKLFAGSQYQARRIIKLYLKHLNKDTLIIKEEAPVFNPLFTI